MRVPWLEQIVKDAEPGLPMVLPYLASRGVATPTAQAHRLGWLSSTYDVATCSAEFIDWQRKYLRDRLIFPLHDPFGNVIGIQTRSLREKAYQLFYAVGKTQGIEPYTFGLREALPAIWTSQTVVLVEGCFDYFGVQSVTPNALACMTAHVPQAVRRLVSRIARRVIVLLDMDEPGREGAARLLSLLPQTCEVFIPCYPAHDPAELAATRPEVLRSLVRPQ